MGYSIVENDRYHWVVTSVTGPGKKARHSRYRFAPEDKFHIQEAKRHYYHTGGTEYYLGDWHTHPNGSCVTSILDRLTLYRNARRADHLQFRSLMLIIGGEIRTATYGAYVEKGRQNLLRKLVACQPLELRFFQ